MLKLLLFVIVLAALVYLTVRVIQKRGVLSPLEQRTVRRPQGPVKRGPVGPDDDEEFLRDLERKRRRQQKPETPES